MLVGLEYQILIVVRFKGGLGNQLFQYALYRRLQLLGRSVKADLSEFSMIVVPPYIREFPHRPFELDVFDGVSIDFAQPEDMMVYSKEKTLLTSPAILENLLSDQMRVQEKPLGFGNHIRRIFKRSSSHLKADTLDIDQNKPLKPWLLEIAYFEFYPQVLSLQDVCLDGIWQSPGYFKEIRSILLNELCFKPSVKPSNADMIRQIESADSVSIHIRRTDYLEHDNTYGGVCTEEYYLKAINLIRASVSQPHFFMFSDDPDWVRDNWRLKDMTVVDINKTDEQYYDMFLISRCKHNIIANSSYSWWAAWLNQNTQKIVISPRLWERDKLVPSHRVVPGWSYI
ncbi:MAG: alpha-1,2-fucosyltransferase [Coriobacteriales bacterium]|jgi:hypothetical protein|nr:alpha-1,2-fucosyltransferase [Coriobacteriales bacterium]